MKKSAMQEMIFPPMANAGQEVVPVLQSRPIRDGRAPGDQGDRQSLRFNISDHRRVGLFLCL
jgi:hypothetical protein